MKVYYSTFLTNSLEPSIREAIHSSFSTPISEEYMEEILRNENLLYAYIVSEGTIIAIGVVLLPITDQEKPQVIALQSKKPGARRILAKGIVDFLQNSGYNTFRAINTTGKPDKVWQRAMTPDGWNSKPIGTLMEFTYNG